MWTGKSTFQKGHLFFHGPSGKSPGLGAWQRRLLSQLLCDPGQGGDTAPRGQGKNHNVCSGEIDPGREMPPLSTLFIIGLPKYHVSPIGLGPDSAPRWPGADKGLHALVPHEGVSPSPTHGWAGEAPSPGVDSSRLGAVGPSAVPARLGPPPPVGSRVGSGRRGRAALPGPLLHSPPRGATPARGPQPGRPQRPSPPGVSRTLLPERRGHSLIGE